MSSLNCIETRLRRILKNYIEYYHQSRAHLSQHRVRLCQGRSNHRIRSRVRSPKSADYITATSGGSLMKLPKIQAVRSFGEAQVDKLWRRPCYLKHNKSAL